MKNTLRFGWFTFKWKPTFFDEKKTPQNIFLQKIKSTWSEVKHIQSRASNSSWALRYTSLKISLWKYFKKNRILYASNSSCGPVQISTHIYPYIFRYKIDYSKFFQKLYICWDKKKSGWNSPKTPIFFRLRRFKNVSEFFFWYCVDTPKLSYRFFAEITL